MRPAPVILLLLIVCLPLSLLAWLGRRMAADEQTVSEQRIRGLLTGQLLDIDQIVSGHFVGTQSELRTIARLQSFAPSDIRAALRDAPLVRQILVYSPDGEILHPSPAPTATLNASEREFLLQASDLITDRDLFLAAGGKRRRQSRDNSRETLRKKDPIPDSSAPSEGWHMWYWGRGVHLFYWQRLQSGHVVGLLVERSRWMADLIATLPQTVTREGDGTSDAGESTISASRIRLLDSSGDAVYQWGSFEPAQDKLSAPFAQVPVSEPLTSWRLQAFVPSELVLGASRSARFTMNAGLISAGVALCLLVAIFWREYRRELREASQRVSFVNQVSHELRTPLTNIRMYADLLESDLEGLPEDESTRPKGRLRVIAEESQRLSRLIGNVLTMARQQRNTLTLKRQPGVVDEVVRDVLRQFEPALKRCEVTASFEANAPDPVSLDVDALEQILVNLFSNVEKYAASGGVLNVATQQTDGVVTLTVSDEGPGVPARQKEAVFQPFYRSSDRLEDAAGTGIGLSIARELARLHGGELRLLESESGATFEVTLG